jgi:hypothetical protein
MRPAARGYARRDAFIARVSNSREPHAETAAQDDKQRLAAAARSLPLRRQCDHEHRSHPTPAFGAKRAPVAPGKTRS